MKKPTSTQDLLNQVAQRTAQQIMEVELFNGSGIPLEDINYVFNKEKLHTLKKQGEAGEMIIKNISYVERMVSEILIKEICYLNAEGFGWVDERNYFHRYTDEELREQEEEWLSDGDEE
jgi:hypothetical protein